MTIVILDINGLIASDVNAFESNLEAFKGRLERALEGTREAGVDFFEYAVMGIHHNYTTVVKFDGQKLKTVSDANGPLLPSLLGILEERY